MPLTAAVHCVCATGLIAEFINPKFAEVDGGSSSKGSRAKEGGDADGGNGSGSKDNGSRAFKAPTRLECLMQDIAWCLPSNAKVGLASHPSVYGTSDQRSNSQDLRTLAADAHMAPLCCRLLSLQE